MKMLRLIKKFTILLTLIFSFSYLLMNSGPAQALINLDDSFKPGNLPSLNIEEASEDKSPETVVSESIIIFIGRFLSKALIFLGVLAIISLIISGAYYILSFGKEEGLSNGKRAVTWSLIGLLSILLSYSLIQGILKILIQLD